MAPKKGGGRPTTSKKPGGGNKKQKEDKKVPERVIKERVITSFKSVCAQLERFEEHLLQYVSKQPEGEGTLWILSREIKGVHIRRCKGGQRIVVEVCQQQGKKRTHSVYIPLKAVSDKIQVVKRLKTGIAAFAVLEAAFPATTAGLDSGVDGLGILQASRAQRASLTALGSDMVAFKAEEKKKTIHDAAMLSAAQREKAILASAGEHSSRELSTARERCHQLQTGRDASNKQSAAGQAALDAAARTESELSVARERCRQRH